MFRGILRPGQGFQRFKSLTRNGNITGTGRPQTGALTETGQVLGIISQASQRDQDQWKQNGHPITHTIVQRAAKHQASATDILLLTGRDGKERRFLVQGKIDPGELGHFTVYYVEEREDLQ